MNLVTLTAAVLEDLVEGDTQPALNRLAATGGARGSRSVSEARVPLVVEVCSVEEALAWAIVLVELGRWEEAAEVVAATICSLLGMSGVPQGGQVRPALAA
jgi:hypothetical protein